MTHRTNTDLSLSLYAILAIVVVAHEVVGLRATVVLLAALIGVVLVASVLLAGLHWLRAGRVSCRCPRKWVGPDR